MASKMKVSELKEQLTKRGLETNGLKKDLVARLEAAMSDADDADDTDKAPAPTPTRPRRSRANSALSDVSASEAAPSSTLRSASTRRGRASSVVSDAGSDAGSVASCASEKPVTKKEAAAQKPTPSRPSTRRTRAGSVASDVSGDEADPPAANGSARKRTKAASGAPDSSPAAPKAKGHGGRASKKEHRAECEEDGDNDEEEDGEGERRLGALQEEEVEEEPTEPIAKRKRPTSTSALASSSSASASAASASTAAAVAAVVRAAAQPSNMFKKVPLGGLVTGVVVGYKRGEAEKAAAQQSQERERRAREYAAQATKVVPGGAAPIAAVALPPSSQAKNPLHHRAPGAAEPGAAEMGGAAGPGVVQNVLASQAAKGRNVSGRCWKRGQVRASTFMRNDKLSGKAVSWEERQARKRKVLRQRMRLLRTLTDSPCHPTPIIPLTIFTHSTP